MEKDKTYNAKWEFEDIYIMIELSEGNWTSGHYFPGFFEVIEEAKGE